MIKIVKIIVVALTTHIYLVDVLVNYHKRIFLYIKKQFKTLNKRYKYTIIKCKINWNFQNNKYMYFVLIDEEEIKTHLLTNINKFYINNPLNQKFL